MMEVVGEALGGIASGGFGAILGGVTGLIGTGISKYYTYKSEKLKIEEKARDRAHDLATMQLEVDNALKVETLEQRGRMDVAEIGLQRASMKSDAPLMKFADKLTPKQRWLVVLADVFCRMIRPTSTIYFQLLTTAIFVWCGILLHKAGASLADGVNPMRIMLQVVDMVLYLTCTSSTWWFGVRGMSKR